jgi:hypothetical protein
VPEMRYTLDGVLAVLADVWLATTEERLENRTGVMMRSADEPPWLDDGTRAAIHSNHAVDDMLYRCLSDPVWTASRLDANDLQMAAQTVRSSMKLVSPRVLAEPPI